jgi:hypothetical protein
MKFHEHGLLIVDTPRKVLNDPKSELEKKTFLF